MARKKFGAADMTPEMWAQHEQIGRKVLQDLTDRDAAKPADEPKPVTTPMGGTHGGPGGYYWRRGGRIDFSKNPYAQGGPELPRSGHESRKPKFFK